MAGSYILALTAPDQYRLSLTINMVDLWCVISIATLQENVLDNRKRLSPTEIA